MYCIIDVWSLPKTSREKGIFGFFFSSEIISRFV